MEKFSLPAAISEFSLVEYLTIFVSLIFALAVAEYFISIGKILKTDVKVVIDWEYIVWIFILLDTFLVLWYVHWPKIAYVDRGLVYYFALIFPYLIIFVIVSVFFPDLNGKESFIMKEHFQKIRKSFFILLALYFTLEIIMDMVMPGTFPALDLLAKPAYVVLAILSALVDNRWIRYTYIALFASYLGVLFVMT